MEKQRLLKVGTRIVVGMYLIAAIVYSLSIPVWEAPDETGHFAYIKHFRQTRTLPIQGQDAAGEAHQPPLYYAVAAIFSLPADVATPAGSFRSNPAFMWAANGGNAVNINILGTAQTFPFLGQALALHLARLASVVMGAGTIYLIIRIGHTIFPEQPEIGLLAGGLTALTPQYLFITGVLNNDNLLIFCVTGVIWQLFQTIKKPDSRRQWVLVSLWLSAAILTKLTAFAIVMLVGIVMVYLSSQRRSWLFFIQTAAIVGSLLLVLTGWWFWRNQMLYGDPLGNAVYEQLFAANLRQTKLGWPDLRDMLSVQFRSFWALFGWMNVPGPSWYFSSIWVVLTLAVLGWVRVVMKRPFTLIQRQAMAWLILSLLLQEGLILYIVTRCNASCYQGRYLFPVIAAMMLLLSVGLFTLLSAPWNRWLAGTIMLFFAATAVWMPVAVILPAYPLTPQAGWQVWFGTQKARINFDNQFVLRGHTQDITDTNIEIQLYWQAVAQPDFDYSTFVHLINSSGQLVAQADVGLGQAINYLPTSWAVGDIVAEFYNVTIPPGLPSGTYQIRTGVYNWISGDRLPIYDDDNPVQDFATFDEITVP